MSKTVDERIVSMRFDNKNFESNVKTSMGTLEKLKKSLKLTEAAKGLESISNAAKKFDISPMGNGVEAVKMKFSALEVMAVTALANITNSAVNAGKKVVAAFTIDPVKSGFQEYETQINAVQTILANTQSKGTTLDQVNEALDTLNTYADKTIYNFTEMTRNIGTFTAAGVDLDTSVNAIQGIANLAATSGSTSQQASTAMYQLSQALAAGTVKLQDWNSVVNAGMGGQVFQDALKETARVHGIAIDDMIKEEGSFRETLQKGWLTSDILTETLQHFTEFTDEYNEKTLKAQGYTDEQIAKIKQLGITGTEAATKVKTFTQLFDTLKEAAQSGWTQSWEILIGDFEEAKTLLTNVSDVFGEIINKSAEARNKVLQEWKDLGGRQDLIDSFWNIFNAISNIVKPIKEAFRDIFPPKTGAQLKEMTGGFKDLTAKVAEFTEKHGKQLYSIFKGIFSVIDIGLSFIKALAGGILKLASNLTGFSGGVLGATASIGDFLSKIRDSIKNTNVFGTTINKIVGFIQKFIDKIKETGIIETVVDKIKEFINALKTKISMPGFDFVFGFMKKIWNIFQKVGSVVSKVGAAIGKAFSAIGSGLSDAFKNGDLKSGLDLLNSGILTTILLGVKKYITGVTDAFDDNTVGIFERIKKSLDKVSDIFDSVKDSLKAWQQDLKASTLLKIAGAIGILAASILIIASINPEKLAASLGAITVLFADLMGSMAIFDKLGSGKITGLTKTASSMIIMSVAVLILTSAMKKLSQIDTDDLYTGIVGVTTLLAELVVVSIIMSKSESKMVKGSVGIILLAASIKILASVCKTFSTMSWEEIRKGLTGVTVLLGELTVVSIVLSKTSSKMVKGSIGLVLLGSAMKIISSVCKDFSSMSWDEIVKGLTGVTALFAELTIVSIIFSKTGSKMIKGSVGLVLLGAAMKILASACKDFASMSWTEIGTGLLGLASALTFITTAINFMPKNMLSIGVGLMAISTAILILSNALGSIGGMSIPEIGKSLFTLSASLTVLAIALNFMNGTIAGSAALLVAASALTVLSVALKILGSMSLGEVLTSLIALAGALTIIGIAGVALSGAIIPLMGLGAAIALIGIGCLAVGAGLLAFSAGLTALSVSGVAGVSALMVILNEFILLIPTLFSSIATGLVGMITVIGNSASQIATAVIQILSSIIETARTLIPQFISLVVEIVSSMLSALCSLTPQIVQSGFSILLSILQGIRDNIGEVTTTAIDIVINFINALGEKLPDIIQAGIDLVFNLIEGIGQGIEDNAERLREVMISFAMHLWNGFCAFFGIHSPSTKMAQGGVYLIQGLIKGIIGMIPAAIKSIISLGIKLVVGLGSKIGDFLKMGKDFIVKLIKGIGSKIKDGVKAVKDFAKSLISGVKEKASDFIDAGKHLIGGLVNGIKNKAKDAVKAAKGIAKDVVSGVKNFLGIHSPSRVFEAIGEYVIEGFAKGLEDKNGKVKSGSEALAKTAVVATSAIKDSIPVYNASSDAIKQYASNLYLLSDAYKKEQETVENSKDKIDELKKSRAEGREEIKKQFNSIQELYDKQIELEELVEQYQNSNTKAGQERLKQYQNELDNVNSQIKSFDSIAEAKKEIQKLTEENAKIDERINELNSASTSGYNDQVDAIDNTNKSTEKLDDSVEEVSDSRVDDTIIAKDAAYVMEELNRKLKKSNGEVKDSVEDIGIAYAGITAGIKNMPEDPLGIKSMPKDPFGVNKNNKKETIVPNNSYYRSFADQLRTRNSIVWASQFKSTTDRLEELRKTNEELRKTNDDSTKSVEDKVDALKDLSNQTSSTSKANTKALEAEKEANSSRIEQLKQLITKDEDYKKQIDDETDKIRSNASYLEQNNKILDKQIKKRDSLKNKLKAESKNHSKLISEKTRLEKEYKKVSVSSSKEDVERTKAIKSRLAAIDKDIKLSDKRAKKLNANLKSVRYDIKTTKEYIAKNEEELAEQTKEFYKELSDSIKDNVNKYTDPLKMSFDSGVSDLFNKLEDETVNMTEEGFRKSSEEMIKSMQSQVDGVKEWQSNLKYLAKKLDAGLLEKLKELGPSASKEIQAFIHMTNEEFKMANKLFEEEQKMSTESLLNNYRESAKKASEWNKKMSQIAKAGFDKDILSEIGEMDIDKGLEYMDVLLNMTNAQIAEFNQLRDKTSKIANKASKDVISSYEYAGSEAADAYRKGIEKASNKKELVNTCIKFGKALATNTSKGMTKPIFTGLVKGISDAIKTSVSTSGDKTQKSFESVGKYSVTGFAKGIKNNLKIVKEAAEKLANEAYKSAMKKLDAHSPSKVFIKVGSYIPQGFAMGIDKFSKKVANSSMSMADAAIDIATNSIRTISDVVNGGLDIEPTITPVIDMDYKQMDPLMLTADISAMVMKPIDTVQSLIGKAQEEINASNNRVIDAINGLREDIQTFCTTDDKELALYVDSKKMASALVNPMNRQLNVIARRQGGL